MLQAALQEEGVDLTAIHADEPDGAGAWTFRDHWDWSFGTDNDGASVHCRCSPRYTDPALPVQWSDDVRPEVNCSLGGKPTPFAGFDVSVPPATPAEIDQRVRERKQ